MKMRLRKRNAIALWVVLGGTPAFAGDERNVELTDRLRPHPELFKKAEAEYLVSTDEDERMELLNVMFDYDRVASFPHLHKAVTADSGWVQREAIRDISSCFLRVRL
jgi:hypothetical protein